MASVRRAHFLKPIKIKSYQINEVAKVTTDRIADEELRAIFLSAFKDVDKIQTQVKVLYVISFGKDPLPVFPDI